MLAQYHITQMKKNFAKAVPNGRINYSNLFYSILWAKILFYYLNFKWICKNEIFISSNDAALHRFSIKPNPSNQIERDREWTQDLRAEATKMKNVQSYRHVKRIQTHCVPIRLTNFWIQSSCWEKAFFFGLLSIEFYFFFPDLCPSAKRVFSCDWWISMGIFCHSVQMSRFTS